MLTFKTQFPIAQAKSAGDFLECVRTWMKGSPHAELAGAAGDTQLGDGVILTSPNETLSCSIFNDANHDIAGVRFEKREDDAITWVTDVVASKSHEKFVVAVQLSVDSDLPVERLDQGKAPYVLKSIMQTLGGGMDGALKVSNSPRYLTDDELSLAADMLCARTASKMPIVYVSAGPGDKPVIDEILLARWLPGMAHVVVEPSRAFSFKLQREVYGENVYGGAVGIYWPDGVGKWTFLLGGKFATAMELQLAVVRKVRSSLLSQRTQRDCTWSNLQELVARARILDLRESGSSNVDEYIAHFDAELASKDDEIRRLEAELARAKYGQPFEADRPQHAESIEIASNERDLYQGERMDIVMDAIRAAFEGAPDHSRRSDVLGEIVRTNNRPGEREAILERLKPLMHQYDSMTSGARAEFEALGFEILDEGKHYKLHYRGDVRYPYILSKTASDWRSGKNAFSSLRLHLF